MLISDGEGGGGGRGRGSAVCTSLRAYCSEKPASEVKVEGGKGTSSGIIFRRLRRVEIFLRNLSAKKTPIYQ